MKFLFEQRVCELIQKERIQRTCSLLYYQNTVTQILEIV